MKSFGEHVWNFSAAVCAIMRPKPQHETIMHAKPCVKGAKRVRGRVGHEGMKRRVGALVCSKAACV
eukprot:3235166-Rhodomonas_salina.2